MPADAAVLAVGDLDLVAVRLGPHHVHAEEHLGPVAGLGAAGAGVDGDEGVAVVVRAREHRPQLEGLEVLQGLVGGVRGCPSSNESSPASSASSISASRSSAWPTSSSNGLRTRVERLQLVDDGLGLVLVVPEVGPVHLALRARRVGPACRPSQRESRRLTIRSITLLASRFSSASIGRLPVAFGQRSAPAAATRPARSATVGLYGAGPSPASRTGPGRRPVPIRRSDGGCRSAMAESGTIADADVVGRLAPSPTGGLHVGHARTFLIAWLMARGAGGPGHPPDRGHRRLPGPPRDGRAGDDGPPLARPRLGRGAGRRRPVGPLRPVGAARTATPTPSTG